MLNQNVRKPLRSRLILCILLAVIVVLGAYAYEHNRGTAATLPMSPRNSSISASALKLTSPAFGAKAPIPSIYTCDGEEKNPPLTLAGVPKGTESLVLILEDPDVPSGTFTHWVLYDIPPATAMIEEGAGDDAGVSGRNSDNATGYIGPCPPTGTHRYIFSLYALNTKLGLPEGASKEEVLNAMNGQVLAQTELIGIYAKKK